MLFSLFSLSSFYVLVVRCKRETILTDSLFCLFGTMFQRQSWKQLPEPYQMCRNIASGYNKCHSQDNQYNSATQSECQTFPEDCYSEEYSRYRFQSSEDGCRGRTYILHSLRSAEEGYGCREDCQCNQVPP